MKELPDDDRYGPVCPECGYFGSDLDDSGCIKAPNCKSNNGRHTLLINADGNSKYLMKCSVCNMEFAVVARDVIEKLGLDLNSRDPHPNDG